MINLSEASITKIVFFDYSHEVQIGECEYEEIQEYSADIVINDSLVVQLSGKGEEAHRPSIPESHERYYNNSKLQDWAQENLDIDDVEKFLDDHGIENNYNFLNENGEEY